MSIYYYDKKKDNPNPEQFRLGKLHTYIGLYGLCIWPEIIPTDGAIKRYEDFPKSVGNLRPKSQFVVLGFEVRTDGTYFKILTADGITGYATIYDKEIKEVPGQQ